MKSFDVLSSLKSRELRRSINNIKNLFDFARSFQGIWTLTLKVDELSAILHFIPWNSSAIDIHDLSFHQMSS